MEIDNIASIGHKANVSDSESSSGGGGSGEGGLNIYGEMFEKQDQSEIGQFFNEYVEQASITKFATFGLSTIFAASKFSPLAALFNAKMSISKAFGLDIQNTLGGFALPNTFGLKIKLPNLRGR